MKVKELINELQKYPQDAGVYAYEELWELRHLPGTGVGVVVVSGEEQLGFIKTGDENEARRK